jgi:thiol-disulfide isomerase/thioredoxin
MQFHRRLLGFALCACLALTASIASAQSAASPAGRWDGTVVVNKIEIPFAFEIEHRDGQWSGAFFDGDLRMPSTGGRFENGTLTLAFDQYGSKVEATFAGGRLEGRYDRGTRGAAYPFRAERTAARAAQAGAPRIDGVWTIPTKSNKGEEAWRFIARQTGADVSAAILRVDGDTGTLSGSFRDGRFVLSHFSGARPLLLEVTLTADGTLEILQNKQTRMTALRADDARAAALPSPTDPSKHTRAVDPSQVLEVTFPDLDGNLVSTTDARFRGKVVILSITGSWCPNCHDEAPFLAELYKKHRRDGLEVVAISFEEAAQLEQPERLRAFLKRYDIQYTVLLAGQPDELNAKLPQFENLNAFPTTVYLGRDGRVRYVHAGFPSPASGAFYTQARDEISHQVERLLAEPVPSVRPTSQAAARPASLAPAQAARPAQLDLLTSVTPRARGVYELAVDVTPHPGMHVYAPGATGYIAINLALEPRAGVAAKPARYPRAEKYLFKPLNETVDVFQQPFRIAQDVVIDAGSEGGPGPMTLSGILSYQACDDQLCYKPERIPVAWTIK